MKSRVLLADDHVLVRHGLRRIIESHPEFSVIAEAQTGAEAVELCREHQPDLAVLDVTMKNLNGLDALVQIRQQAPQTAVAMLSMHADERYVLRALRSGARAYIVKDCVEDELIEALFAVLKGKIYLSPSVEAFRSMPADRADRYDLLTARERQIYQLLAEGSSSKDVANKLDLSLHTVETHRSRLMDKLGIHTVAELVLSAVRRGLVS